MSPRSIYLRDQAENLQWHANAIGDAETQEQLRKLIEAVGPFCFGLIRNSVKKVPQVTELFIFISVVTAQDVDSSRPYPILGQGHQGAFHDWQADDPGKVATTVRIRKAAG